MKLKKRPGYTVVELMTVISIIITLCFTVGILIGGSYIGFHFLAKMW